MAPTSVYLASTAALAEMLKDQLLSQGIDATVAPKVHPLGWHADNCVEVWIVNAADLERARAIVQEFEQRPAGSVGWNWRCPGCGEQVEPQFTECWRCGASRER